MEPTVPTHAGGGGLLDRLEPRLSRRAVPRLTIALAAAGCALVVLGSLVVGGDGLGDGDGGGSRFPGLLLTLAVVVAGFVVLTRERSGPIATAGSVASTLAIPPVLFFLTFDAGSLPPYSTDTILMLSTAAWVAAWLFGPGRGRPLYLGAAAVGLWATVLQVTEGVFDFPFVFPALLFGQLTIADSPALTPIDEGFGFGGGLGIPDPTTVGILSLLVGVGYLVLVHGWDRRGRVGAATAVVPGGLLALAVGVAFLAADLEGAGTGVLLLALGTAVAALGATLARRATTWLGAAGAAFGALLVVGEITDDATPGGLLLILAGGGIVAGAEALRRATEEPDELNEVTVAEPTPF